MKSLLASAGAAAVREAFGSVHPVSSGRPALDLLGIEDDVEAERLQLRERTLRRLGPVCLTAGFMAALAGGFRLARRTTPYGSSPGCSRGPATHRPRRDGSMTGGMCR